MIALKILKTHRSDEAGKARDHSTARLTLFRRRGLYPVLSPIGPSARDLNVFLVQLKLFV